jgi:hypothetical protein
LTRFDVLPFGDVNGCDCAALAVLHSLTAAGNNDDAWCNHSGIERCERCPTQKTYEEKREHREAT